MKENNQEAMEKLKMMIEPFVLRRVKKDVLKELPEKSITVLNNEMQGEQLEIYLSYLAQAKKEAMTEIEGNGFEKSQIKILALLTRLRQICCHPSLFLEDYMGESSKLTQCIEIVKDAIAGKHKILIFSGYTSMLNIIEGNLAKEGINYYKLTGQTKVDERVKLVNDFNNNPDIKVFLISLKAGGTGLNLIGADMVIHYDPWWNMSAENQATDRAYRIGQKNNVQVYKLITKNSIEEKIYELQEKKSKLIDSMLSTQTTFKDGSFLDLEQNEDIKFLNSLEYGMEVDYKDLEKGKIRVPVYRSLYLNKLLENVKNVEIKKDKEYKEIVNNIDEREYDNEIVTPNGLNCTLRYYQKIGYKWLKILDGYRLGGILADDMGLGKTVQLISLLLDYKENAKVKLPSIVITPSSLALNWKSEIEKFAKDIKVLVIRGTSEEREKQIKQIPEFDLVITSYDLLKRDMEVYKKEDILFKYQIADEAQYIKNSNTQNAKSLKTINAQTRYALTGTPIENSLAELWSIFDYIMPGYLFTYKKFKQLYEIPIMKENDQEAMEKLKMMIEPFVLRRVKKDVLKELPEKSITVLNNEMQGEQLEIYLSYLAQAKKEAMTEIEGNGFEKSQIKILALLTRLRQICCHPSLFLEDYMGESSKLTQCIEIVKDAIAGKHKILIFSGYTSMLNIIEGNLAKEGINYYKLTGQTKVDERVKLVNDFNNNPDIKVFLISLKAGGTGLNLIGADMVIHYDPWWNMSAENQATDRAYRIGQKNNVQVYKLITKNSIEEKIYELQEKKSKLIDNMLSTQTTFINKLNKDDIMELFN